MTETSWITSNSSQNNIRPYVVADYAADGPGLMWMNGYYEYWITNKTYPNGYPTSIQSEFELPKKDMNVEDALIYQKDFTGTSQENRTIEGDLLKTEGMDSFTISINANIEESNYVEGHDFKVFSFADDAVALSVKDIDSTDNAGFPGRLPVLKIGSTEVKSTNILSDSDWCQTVSGTTGRAKNVSNMGWTNFTVTYDGKSGVVATYIDGVLDAKRTVEPGILADIAAGRAYSAGGFAGEVGEVKVFSCSMSPYEVKQMLQGNLVVEVPGEFAVESISLKNNVVEAKFQHPEKKEVRLIVAVYDQEDRVIETQCMDVTEETHRITLKEDLKEKKIKVFLWDTQLKPIQKEVVLQ